MKLLVAYTLPAILLTPVVFLFGAHIVYMICLPLLLVLSIVSALRKRKAGWQWIKPNSKGIGIAVLSLFLTTVMLFVMHSNFGRLFHSVACAFLGMGYFNILIGLNLADKSKDEFNERVRYNGETASDQATTSERTTLNQKIFRVFFFMVWLLGMYLFYSYGQFQQTYSTTMTVEKTKAVQPQNTGSIYYVNEAEHKAMKIKAYIIIPHFCTGHHFPYFHERALWH